MFEFTDASEDTCLVEIRVERMLKRVRTEPAYRTALSIWAPRRLLINLLNEFVAELEAIEKEEHPEEWRA